MRTTKIIAISIPPDFESKIQKHAKSEHRTVSEYVREAIRHYMNVSRFEAAHKRIELKARRRGLKRSDIDKEIDRLRFRKS